MSVCVKKSRIFRNTFKIIIFENLEPVHSSTGRIKKKIICWRINEEIEIN